MTDPGSFLECPQSWASRGRVGSLGLGLALCWPWTITHKHGSNCFEPWPSWPKHWD